MISILVFGALFLVAGAFLMHRLSKRDDQRFFGATGRWGVSIVLIVWLGVVGQAAAGGGIAGAIIALVAAIPALVILAMIWIPVLVDRGLGGLTEAMTGGNEPIEAKPYYFRVHALRRKGDFRSALEEIQGQLERFPLDWEGQDLRSQILVDDLEQPASAISELLAYESQPDLDEGNRNLSRFRRSEIHLRNLKDPDTARETLRSIVAAAPGSESARIAEQHLAHMMSGDPAAERSKPLSLGHSEVRIGLTSDLGASQRVESDPFLEAKNLIENLAEHPSNWEARERLATLYSERMGRPDLAILELRHLAGLQGMGERRVSTWLNRITDNCLRVDPPDVDGARSALQEIQDRYPESAVAAQALRRLAILQRDVRSLESRSTLKIGQYEQNIGLKRGSAEIPNPDPNTRAP